MMRPMTISFLLLSLFSPLLVAQDNGEILYKQCAGCHGNDGKNKAFGKSAPIAGRNADELVEVIKAFKDVDHKMHGTTSVMSKQVKTMSTQDMKDVANYIAQLK